MFSPNGPKNNSGDPALYEPGDLDIYDFDRDLDLDFGPDRYNRPEPDEQNLEGPDTSGDKVHIPTFGINRKNFPPTPKTAGATGVAARLRPSTRSDQGGTNPVRAGAQATTPGAAAAKDKKAGEQGRGKGGGRQQKNPGPPKVLTRKDNRWRFFFGLILFLIGLGGSIFLVQANTTGIEVIVATRDIAAGQTLTGADFTTARISVPPDLAALLIDSRDLNTLLTGENAAASTGTAATTTPKVAVRLLRSHQPVMVGDIASAASLNRTGVPQGLVALALPVSAATAVTRVSAGDRVTLIYVNNKLDLSGDGSDYTRTTEPAKDDGLEIKEADVLAEGITVLDVTRSSSGIGLGSAGSQGNATGGSGNSSDNLLTGGGSRPPVTNLTLLVSVAQAQKIATAKETGTIDVVLLPPAYPGAAGPVSSPVLTPDPTGALAAPRPGTTLPVTATSNPAGNTTASSQGGIPQTGANDPAANPGGPDTTEVRAATAAKTVTVSPPTGTNPRTPAASKTTPPPAGSSGNR